MRESFEHCSAVAAEMLANTPVPLGKPELSVPVSAQQRDYSQPDPARVAELVAYYAWEFSQPLDSALAVAQDEREKPAPEEYFFGDNPHELPGPEVLSTFNPFDHLAPKPPQSPSPSHVAKIPETNHYLRWFDPPKKWGVSEAGKQMLETYLKHLNMMVTAGEGLVRVPDFRAWVGESLTEPGQETVFFIVEGIDGELISGDSRNDSARVLVNAKYTKALKDAGEPLRIDDISTEEQWMVREDGQLHLIDLDPVFSASRTDSDLWHFRNVLKRLPRRDPHRAALKEVVSSLDVRRRPLKQLALGSLALLREARSLIGL